MKWEIVHSSIENLSFQDTERMRIPGGWLVRSIVGYAERGYINNDVSVGTGLTFIPDPEHKWKLEETK